MPHSALRPSRPRSQGMGDKNSTRSRNDNQNRASRRKARPQIILFTENVRGLKRDEDLEAALASVGQRGGLAACWQETWRTGKERLECPGIGAVLLAGRDQQVCSRGQEGVGIALTPTGVDAWKQAGPACSCTAGIRGCVDPTSARGSSSATRSQPADELDDEIPSVNVPYGRSAGSTVRAPQPRSCGGGRQYGGIGRRYEDWRPCYRRMGHWPANW